MQKSDILKMGATALITCLAFYFFSPTANTFPFSMSKDRPPSYGSEPISADTFFNLTNNYRTRDPFLLRYQNNPNDAEYQYGNLEGFRFSVSSLEEIIHNNNVLDGNNKPIQPDEVMVYIGEDSMRWRKPGLLSKKRPNIRIITIGVHKNSNGQSELMLPKDKRDYNDKSKSSIFDKADPCPGPGCPQTPPPPPPPPSK